MKPDPPHKNSPHNKLSTSLAAAPCTRFYAYKDFSCFNNSFYTGYYAVEGMHPPGLHHSFSNLITAYRGSEEAIHHWRVGDMHIVLHEKYRGF